MEIRCVLIDVRTVELTAGSVADKLIMTVCEDDFVCVLVCPRRTSNNNKGVIAIARVFSALIAPGKLLKNPFFFQGGELQRVFEPFGVQSYLIL